MPTFTFTKSHDYRDGDGDPNVTMTFTTDSLQTLRENFEDFIQGAGFAVKPEPEHAVDRVIQPEFERRLTQEDFLAKEEDWLWDDALAAKFANDVIKFPEKKNDD